MNIRILPSRPEENVNSTLWASDAEAVGRMRRNLNAWPLSELIEKGKGAPIDAFGMVLDYGNGLNEAAGKLILVVADDTAPSGQVVYWKKPDHVPPVTCGDCVRIMGKVYIDQAGELVVEADDVRFWPMPEVIDLRRLKATIRALLSEGEELVAKKETVTNPKVTVEAIFDLGYRASRSIEELSFAATAIDVLTNLERKLGATASAYNHIFGTSYPDEQDFAWSDKAPEYSLLDGAEYPNLGYEHPKTTDDAIPF